MRSGVGMEALTQRPTNTEPGCPPYPRAARTSIPNPRPTDSGDSTGLHTRKKEPESAASI
jgi:hypothetical protein